MNLYALAFFTGLFGSLHCIAMCGPLVMALPTFGRAPGFVMLQKLLYQSGRIFTYTVLGALLALFGTTLQFAGLQQLLSLASGILLLLMASVHFFNRSTRLSVVHNRWIVPLSKGIGYWLMKPYGGFLAGAMNGLLPCGLIWVALISALNTGSILEGAGFMAAFGFGTTPLMILSVISPLFLPKTLRARISKGLPYVTMLIGILLLVRAAGAGIPYLSPALPTSAISTCF